MTDLLAARSQMAMSLGFHIIFAAVGMAMPLLMVIAEAVWLKTRNEMFLELARRWSRGVAIMFAVGAVSGTVLSFELGLLWPTFMEFAGPIVGMPFSLEGFAFFLEAIFLGVYLYGWERVKPWVHLASGVGVCICGVASAVFVIAANSWMNTPVGFVMDGDRLVSVDVWEAMANPMWMHQSVHMVIAAFAAVGFAVAGIHAGMLLRRGPNPFHHNALLIALLVGGSAAAIQPLSGDLLAKDVARYQPVKLAAFEGHFKTERRAPLRIGGIPNEATRETPYAIEIPGAFSFLAYGDFDAEVQGLEDYPEDLWPPVAITHFAFQIMVGCGFTMLGVFGWAALIRLRRRRHDESRRFLWACVLAAPLGFVAIEAGWVVTEVGRQPWVIQGVMKTADAVTPMPHLTIPFLTFTLLYLFLGVVVIYLLARHVFQSPTVPDGD